MSKFIGDVSAYAYAVNKGYTGTEEEFAELMASYATVGQTAVDAKDAAVAAQTAAQTAATTATNKASEATTAAQTATTKAGEASQSASTATSAKDTAVSASQTATSKASEAAQSATTASNKATETSGYATASQTAQGLAESARDSAQGYAEDAQGYAEDAQASAESISASASQIAQNTADIASLEEDRYKPYVVDSASGSIASFPDGADDIPLKSLIVNIDPVQDLSNGDPSPENICPISGWTGCKINATNDNLICDSLPSDYFVCGAIQTGDTTIPNGSTYRAYCVYVGKNAKIGYKKEVNPSTNLNLGLAFADVYLTSRTGSVIYNALNMANRSNNTLNSGEHPYLVIVVLNSNINNKTYNTRKAYVFLNNNGRSVSFSPQRNIDKYAIDWSSEAGTVYGGRLDVLTGILTVYPYYASYNGETLTGRWISDRDVYSVGTTPTIGAQVVDMSGTGTEVQLEPHEVASLLGANNLWADTGDTAVEYRADTKLYIEKLTQPEEDDMIADSAISEGQFFMIGNSLYRALANIASGATITVGTNAQRVSLSDALNLVNA